jgi:tetratricopeptide (TPR) repeat protein
MNANLPTRLLTHVLTYLSVPGKICFLFLISGQLLAATILQGVVVRERENGSPVAGVVVRADGANPVTSGPDGRFRLVFPQREPGQEVSIKVHYTGWVVVNQVLLERHVLDANNSPFHIVLCKQGEFDKWANIFYRSMIDRIVLQEFQKRVAELDQRPQLTEPERTLLLQEKLKLMQQKNQAQTQTDDLLHQLIEHRPKNERGSFSDAKRLFLAGKLDLALKRLNEDKLEHESKLLQNKSEQAAQAWLLRAKLLTLRFDLVGTERAYDKAVQVASGSFDAWFQYAVFHQHQNHYSEADRGYQRALPIAREAGNLVNVAAVRNNLGNLYRDESRTAQAREAYEEALTIYRALGKIKPDVYLPYVATLLNNIGILNSTENHKAEAHRAYAEALSIDRVLAQKKPEQYLGVVASTLNNLGILHSDESRHKEARHAYDEALSINRRMALVRPETYLPAVAVTLNNLGNLHSDENQNQDARGAYDEALAIYRKLARQNPDVYLPDIATTLNNLGILYREKQEVNLAEAAYDEALRIRRKLAERNPNVYLPTVAEILNNVGSLHSTKNRPEDARQAYDEALSIYRRFAVVAPATYTPVLRRVEYNLSLLPNNEKMD